MTKGENEKKEKRTSSEARLRRGADLDMNDALEVWNY
jgi:hypothetical protein